MTDIASPVATPTVVPPAIVGILGGGPTTRYFERAAQQLGYRTRVIDPKLSPQLLESAAAECEVITVVDQLPTESMHVVASKVPVHPSPDVVERCRDRVRVKQFLEDLGAGVGPYISIESDDDIAAAADTKFSAILKLRNHGGGRAGQVRVAAHAQLLDAWETLGRRPCVLEQRLTLGRELAITVVRTAEGQVAAFNVSQQQYVHGRLEISYAPASLLRTGQADAAELGEYIANELGMVGVLSVHMFVVGRDVYVHELIPHPNALALFTLDACRSDQYEQQLRAVCGLALGDVQMTVPGIAVVSLANELWTEGEPKWERILGEGTAHLHLYSENGNSNNDGGNAEIRGHLAACSGTAAGSTSLVRRLRKQLSSS